ncbi:MAG: hypothetical protein Q9M92_10485 [Enterobacterales bacterium]|nr:hypothetical protein [Enterobacterales bacterium]
MTKIKLTLVLIAGLLIGVIIGMRWMPRDNPQSSLESFPSTAMNQTAAVVQVPMGLESHSALKQTSVDQGLTVKTNAETHQANQKLQQLNQQIKQLQQALADKEKALASALAENEALMSIVAQIDTKKSEDEVVQLSQAEVDKFLPSPFNQAMVGAKGSLAKYFNQYIDEEIDYNWNQEMENNINQFITLHQQSYNLELESVHCKSTTCEVRGFEKAGGAWQIVMVGMMQQDWWQFGGSSSTSRAGNSAESESSIKQQNYFYLLASTSP